MNNSETSKALQDLRCLALETSGMVSSVAACNHGRQAAVSLPATQGSSRTVFHAVREVLAQLRLTPADLDCIAFGCGPGSFTGVRVATSAAQGLAYSIDCPVISVSSLAAVAANAFAVHGAQRVAVCVDARMGEVYTGLYKVTAAGCVEALAEDGLAAPEAWTLPGLQSPAASDASEAPPWFAAGNGWLAYPALLERNHAALSATDSALSASAGAVLAIAAVDWRVGKGVPAAEALPHYIRDKVTG